MTYPTPALGEQIQVDVGACRREDVALWQFASITEQGAQGGQGFSTTEKAVVHIAHGCAILERHDGGLPLELRLQVRAAVESTTE